MKKTVDKNKKRIGFDIDGVLLDHKKHRTMLARRMGYLDVTEKMSAEEVKSMMDKKDDKKRQDLQYGRLTLKTPATKGAARVLKKLGKVYDIYVISARKPGDNRKYALRMLKKYFDFPEEKINFVIHNFQKGFVARRLGLSIFIDDNKKSFYLMPQGVKKILFDEYQKRPVMRRKGGLIGVKSHKDLLKWLIG
jgi:5'(3')-deoxyribonucleotidase